MKRQKNKILIIISFILISFYQCSTTFFTSQCLQLYSPSSAVEILNRGIAGNNTNDLLKRVQKDVIEQNPDLVIMMIGTNDFCNDKKFISVEQYEKNLDSLIILITKKSYLILLTIPPVEWEKIFKRHDKTKYPENYQESIAKCNKIIKTRKYCAIIDINNYFKLAEGWFIDGVHPSDLANKFIAAVIHQHIVNNYDYLKIKRIICFGNSITESKLTKYKYSDYLKILFNSEKK